MMQHLGIDSSTQSMSALVLNAKSGDIVFEHSINFGASLPTYKSPNGFIPNRASREVHTHPMMWVEAIDMLFQSMKAKGFDFSRIKGISGCGQQHGSVYLNGEFENALAALNPERSLKEQLRDCFSRTTSPIWMDTSTSAECTEIADKLGGNSNVCKISGSKTTERFTGPQIRRFFKTEPKHYASTKKIHLVSSFIASILSGQSVSIDYGDGAGMNLMNLSSGKWDAKLLEATADGLGKKLPELKPSSTVCGDVADYFVSKYGFAKKTPVVLFTGDNPSSLIGMGGVKPGTAVISLGTSDTFFAAMTKSVTDPQGYGHVFGNPGGGFMSLICFLNGSLAREKLKAEFNLSWSDFDIEALRKTPAGNNGNLMLPFFGQEITPFVLLEQPKRHGSRSFMNAEDTPSQVRALLEGQFINMKLHSKWISEKPKLIRLTGGASQNDGIAQTIANIFGVSIERLSISNSAALGAAMRVAQATSGIDWETLESRCLRNNLQKPIKSDTSLSKVYSELEKKYEELLHSIL